jgi:hypothetical protein
MSSKEFRVVGFDYDIHIYNELGKRISSSSGQTISHAAVLNRADKEMLDTNGETMIISISKVIEVKE